MPTIPLSRPDITEHEIANVIAVLKTPQLSLGPKLNEFEEKFAAFMGVEFAVAVNSGTAGLHLAVASLDISENDAVITTPFSFVASANCILFQQATPIFVDIEPHTFNLSIERLKEHLEQHCTWKGENLFDKQTGKRIKAILPVHVFGQPCDMNALMDLAQKYRLAVIEDACEAIGAEYHGKKAGTFGEAGVFAFYPNKQITTGEGGMIVTNNKQIAGLCRSLRNQGRGQMNGWLMHEQLGYNYRLSEINCALGIAQLERIGEILEKRERVAQVYNQQLQTLRIQPRQIPATQRSWFVYVVLLPEKFAGPLRNQFMLKLRENGIECSNYFPPIHLQPYFRKMFGYRPGDFPVTENIAERTLALPFHNNLSVEEIEFVSASLKEIMNSMDIIRSRRILKTNLQKN